MDRLSDLSLDAFLSLISEINDVTSITARVDVSDLDSSVIQKKVVLTESNTVARDPWPLLIVMAGCLSP